MRIVLVHSHATTLGGGERAVLEVARGLRARHDVVLALGRFEPQSTYAELASFPRVRLRRLSWLSARLDADAIVTNSFGANLLALRQGGRVAYWAHSTRSRFLQPGARRPDLVARRMLDQIAVKRAALLVANSLYTAERARRLYGRQADAVVYPGVDLETFTPGPFVEQPTYALSVGRVSPEKGLENLLSVWDDLGEIPLHIVGDGPAEYVRALRERARGPVIFRGPLVGNALVETYRNAAVAVFAAPDEEFGIAPLEAMACGVPSVVWAHGGPREIVVDGETGFLAGDIATFAARVRLLIRNADRRLEAGLRARQRAQAFSWDATVRGIEAVCERLAHPRLPACDGSPAPPPAR